MNLRTLAERFCSAPLPESVCADPCASMQGYPNRTGTNLLTVVEAKQVLAHVLDDVLDTLTRLEDENAASRRVLLRISQDASGTERIRNIAKDALGL